FAGAAGACEGVAADRCDGDEGGVGGVGCGEGGEAGRLHQLQFRAAPVDIGEGAPEAAGRADGEPDDDGGGGRRGGEGGGGRGRFVTARTPRATSGAVKRPRRVAWVKELDISGD